jgi:hypothetical protein
MFEFLKDMGNYEDRKVARDDVNGLTVSTAYTSDEGYETAVIDENGAHPVERYEDRAASILGHSKWIEIAKSATTITQLGAWGIVDDSEIILLRKVNHPVS